MAPAPGIESHVDSDGWSTTTTWQHDSYGNRVNVKTVRENIFNRK